MQENFLLDSGIFGWVYRILTPVEWLMTQIMYWFHRFLTLIGMPEVGLSWALSIIFLVVVVQALVFPLYLRTMRSMRAMQAIQPQLLRIQNKYKGKTDPASREAQQREMMKLYRDNNANPAGSCVPMLIQGPVFMCMFYVLSAIPYIAVGKRAPLGAFNVETAQQFSSTTFFGTKISDSFMTSATSGRIIIGIFVLAMCAALWYTQWFSMRRNTAPASMNPQAQMMQRMMLWGMPLMYIFSGTTMPFAVLIYWLANNIMNLLRTIWQVRNFPTPGSPAAEEKEKRDHDNENRRRAREGRPSLEEEELIKAREAEERKAVEGHQRQQPQRRRRNRKR